MHKIMQFYAFTGQYKRAPVVRAVPVNVYRFTVETVKDIEEYSCYGIQV